MIEQFEMKSASIYMTCVDAFKKYFACRKINFALFSCLHFFKPILKLFYFHKMY